MFVLSVPLVPSALPPIKNRKSKIKNSPINPELETYFMLMVSFKLLRQTQTVARVARVAQLFPKKIPIWPFVLGLYAFQLPDL